MLGGFIASNVLKRNTKVILLFFMSKAKNDYLYVPNAENAIWSKMDIVSETLSVFQSVARKLLSV